ncbi:DsrE family protein [Sulfobacillus sp. hq2]|uniref:Sulfur reductase DrsE n=1 Tax=Sulfobacillus thermotolerans TaxID=338644 RepID=A0ABM6RQ46_9FIRM|nr:DsrE family protein [Sulfobacillus sp. hq2]AUW93521.1 sulfur reductase DrsE [Sulfobacillus thermotolerans]MCY0907871.1 DsrE family protein [Sulfobacillus thermotolerans]
MENNQPTLVVLTTGKEAFVRANAILQMTLMLKKFRPDMAVEFLALGPGIEILKSNQKNSPQFGQQLQAMRDAGITISVCEQSMQNLGLTADQMFEAQIVRGGQEVAQRLGEGYHVLTF